MSTPNNNEKKEFCVTWSIKNFTYCVEKKGEKLDSLDFVVDSLDKTRWFLRICPREPSDEKYVSYFLHRHASCSGPDIVPLTYELSLFYKNKTLFCEKTECDFKIDHSFGFVKAFQRSLVIPDNNGRCPGYNNVTFRCRMWKKDGELPESGRCSMQTIIELKRYSFLWKMEKIVECELNKKNSSTIQFWMADDDPRVNFVSFISLDIYGQEKLNLQLEIQPEDFRLATCEIGLMDVKGKIAQTQVDERWLKNGSVWRFPTFLYREKLLEKRDLFLPNDTLTLQCHFTASRGVVYENVENISYGFQCLDIAPGGNQQFWQGLLSAGEVDCVSGETRSLQRDLAHLYNKQSSCDKKLRTSTRVFPGHSAILSARSPVFERMFQSKMKEKSIDEVDVPDLEDDTVRRMLLFVYTDKLEEDFGVETAKKLYYAADKYEIELLKSMCTSFLTKNISVGNVCEVLILADMHQDQKLKSAAVEFVLDNGKEVMRSEQWSSLMKESVQMAAEIMRLHWLR